MKIDLHMHTTYSDGVYTPEELTSMAVQAGLDIIAISDHDTTAAYSGHDFAPGLTVIRAIEMSSECEDEDVHVLGYYIDPHSPELTDYCRQFRKKRLHRALEIVDKCIERGYNLDRKSVEDLLDKGGTVGRPHIARMLVDGGYCPDVKTAFDTLLYRGGPVYVPYKRWSIDECIGLIHAAGGVAVLAHPGLLNHTLSQVLAHPFDGIEVFHPNNRGRFDEFLALAHKHHWLISGGSDFHGVSGRFPETLGLFSVQEQQVADFLALGKKKGIL